MSLRPVNRQEESSSIKNSCIYQWSGPVKIQPHTTLAFRLIGNTMLSIRYCTIVKSTMGWNANGEFRAMHLGREGKSIHMRTLINHIKK